MITIKTNHGDIGVELFDDKAPISCENFRQYITDGHFNGTIFHRVIPNFMIQGGGMDKSMSQKPTRDPIKNEAHNGLGNVRGTIAMARTTAVDSATDQFYINVMDNPFFDFNFETRTYGYAVFGEVVYGMDVVDLIRQQPTENRGGGFSEIPIETIFILRARELGPDE